MKENEQKSKCQQQQQQGGCLRVFLLEPPELLTKRLPLPRPQIPLKPQ
jgi:hypothetical protein